MKLSTLTKPEVDYFIENCNFTDQELTYFKLKTKDYSNVSIASKMSISESSVSNIAKRVKKKLDKIK